MSMRNSLVSLLAASILFATAASAQEKKFNVQIAAQSLSKALEELAVKADVQIVYQSEVARSVQTAGFSGSGTLDEILDALLAGTTLSWRRVNDRTVAVEPRQTASLTPPELESVERAVAPSELSEEIVVTAQMRRQDIRDVPVSVTVISGESLEREGIVSVREIARQTPGFTGSTFNESEPILAIRGANNTFSQAGTSKPVGVFVDGVYVSRNSGSVFDLYDLEQVEILRGPQGTLFGRNVTGGAIVLSTSRPNFGPPSGKVDVGVGNYGTRELRGMIGGSIGATAAGKLSAIVRKSDGYGRDRLAGVDQNDTDSLGLRGQVSFPLGTGVLLRVIGEISADQTHGRTLSTTSPAGADDGDIRTSEHNYPQRYERDTTGLSGHLSWTNPLGELESITAWRKSSSFEDYAFSSTAFSLLPRFNPGFPFQQIGIVDERPQTLSQEIRLVSKSYGRFDYVAGAFYFDEAIDRDSTTIRLGGTTGDTIRDQTFDQDVDSTSYAAYSDVHLALTDELDLNAGARLTYEKKRVQVDFIDRQRPNSDFQSDVFSKSWTEVSPRLALTWRPLQAVSVFGSVTEGFTAGGFNTEEDSPEVIGRAFEPETLLAFELGTKTVFLADRLRLNLTLFHQEYDNKQEGFLDSQFNFVIVNAAEATMDGAELEAQWRPTRNTGLRATYSYLDATYDEFLIPHTGENRSGRFLPTSPEHSYGFGADWRLPVGRGEGAFSASYAWQDDYFTGSENRPTFLIDSYALLDASLSYTSPAGLWRLTFWGKNLTDEEYVLIRSDFGVGGVGEHFGAPQSYGVRVSFNR